MSADRGYRENRRTISVKDGIARIRVEMLDAERYKTVIKNPRNIMANLQATARKYGAKELYIEGSLGNDKFEMFLKKHYNFVTKGGNESLHIALE